MPRRNTRRAGNRRAASVSGGRCREKHDGRPSRRVGPRPPSAVIHSANCRRRRRRRSQGRCPAPAARGLRPLPSEEPMDVPPRRKPRVHRRLRVAGATVLQPEDSAPCEGPAIRARPNVGAVREEREPDAMPSVAFQRPSPRNSFAMGGVRWRIGDPFGPHAATALPHCSGPAVSVSAGRSRPASLSCGAFLHQRPELLERRRPAGERASGHASHRHNIIGPRERLGGPGWGVCSRRLLCEPVRRVVPVEVARRCC